MAGTILLCAGGTGGHLFPAEALARVLMARGWRIELATDHRVAGYGADFPAAAVHIVPSGTVSGRGPAGKALAPFQLLRGLGRAYAMVGRVRPAAAIGFGGYPTVPPMMAAGWRGVPTIIHDQNAVLGRANRFLAGRVKRIAIANSRVALPSGMQGKAVVTGNPVRAAVREAAKTPYPALVAGGPIRLAVFGGSQGARFTSEAVPAALALLPADLRARLAVVQQCRPEDLARVQASYSGIGIAAELAPFFRDLPQRVADSHLVVSRSGASTVAELAVIGRPAILVPLPGAIDQDQTANARLLSDIGGGWLIEQAELTADRLAGELSRLLADPATLADAARNARASGQADGAERLADLVEAVALNGTRRAAVPGGTTQEIAR